jgi:hypothetical protein
MSDDTGGPGAASEPANDGPPENAGAAGTASAAETDKAAGAARAAGSNEAPDRGVAAADHAERPGELLSELAVLRRRARTARRAYWFPLALFGLIGCGAIPFYLATSRSAGHANGVFSTSGSVPALPVNSLVGAGPPGTPLGSLLLGFYWLLALIGGFLLMLAWYRRHARQAGVTSAARSAALTGIILTVLALVLWPVSQVARPGWLDLLFPWFLTIHGMFPFLIIAVSLCVLARAERSWGLAAAAVLFLAATVVACSYNVENVIARLGYFSGAAWFGVLPNLALPVAVLLLSAAAAGGARRWRLAR